MKKSDISKLKTAQGNALINAMALLDGGNMYPKQEDIEMANALINTAVKIEKILRGVTHD